MNLVEEESLGEKKPFNPASFMEFQYSASHFGQVVTRPFIARLMKNIFSLSQPGPRKTRDISENVKKAYPEGLMPIKKKNKNGGYKKSALLRYWFRRQ